VGQGQALWNGVELVLEGWGSTCHSQTRGEPVQVATGAPGRCQMCSASGGYDK
jgi:hypothetical protein